MRSGIRVPRDACYMNPRLMGMPGYAGMANSLTQNDRAEHRTCPATCYTGSHIDAEARPLHGRFLYRRPTDDPRRGARFFSRMFGATRGAVGPRREAAGRGSQ